MEFISTFVNDFSNFINPSANYNSTYTWLVIALFSFLSSFLGLLLSWRIYISYDKNLLDTREFTLKSITIDSFCAVVTTTILYVFKIVLLNVYSVFFFSIFWVKVFTKLIEQGEKGTVKRLKVYNEKAE